MAKTLMILAVMLAVAFVLSLVNLRSVRHDVTIQQAPMTATGPDANLQLPPR